MFDLEPAIADWRNQMLAAGINAPVPLDELENHLREEIARQIQSGMEEQRGFQAAVASIGCGRTLKVEFKKSHGFLSWLDDGKVSRSIRFFALGWLAYCSWIFMKLVVPIAVLASVAKLSNLRLNAVGFLFALIAIIFLRGMIASIRLFQGNYREIKVLRLIAVLGIVAFGGLMITFKLPSTWAIVSVTLSVISLLFLNRPKITNPAA